MLDIRKMSSETIWSNNGTSPLQSSTGTNQYRSVLDQVDPEVAKMLANSNSNPMISGDNDGNSRRFSFNDGSDMDGNFLGSKRVPYLQLRRQLGVMLVVITGATQVLSV